MTDPDWLVEEKKFHKDLEDRIKKICPLAGYTHEEGVSIPDCKRGEKPCLHPEICPDYRSGCQRLNEFNKVCGKTYKKPCPRNICPILMRDHQVEMNKRRLQL